MLQLFRQISIVQKGKKVSDNAFKTNKYFSVIVGLHLEVHNT